MEIETVEGKGLKFTHVLLAEAERRAEILDEPLVSYCCGAPPDWELDLNNHGTCSDCKEGTEFKTLTELELAV